MLDEAAIHFTKTFYVNLFQGDDICSAFNSAKNAVRFKMGDVEANLFERLLKEDAQVGLFDIGRKKKQKH